MAHSEPMLELEKETREILSDPVVLEALSAGLAEIARGKVVSLAELRAELADMRTAAYRTDPR